MNLSLSTSCYSDVINGIDELRAASLRLRAHHQDTAEGKQARTDSPHFGRSLNYELPGVTRGGEPYDLVAFLLFLLYERC